jgi:hypothetical protein
MGLIGTRRYTTEKEHHANPRFRVLDMLGHFTSSLRSASNKYYLPIPHYGNINNMRTVMRGGSGPWTMLEFDCFIDVVWGVKERG